jgi:hypothetical protein
MDDDFVAESEYKLVIDFFDGAGSHDVIVLNHHAKVLGFVIRFLHGLAAVNFLTFSEDSKVLDPSVGHV